MNMRKQHIFTRIDLIFIPKHFANMCFVVHVVNLFIAMLDNMLTTQILTLVNSLQDKVHTAEIVCNTSDYLLIIGTFYSTIKNNSFKYMFLNIQTNNPFSVELINLSVNK